MSIFSSDKLKITSYKKNTFKSSDKISEYVVKYNPASIDHAYDISFDEEQAIGSSGSENKYRHSKPEKLSFEIVFDQTIVGNDEASLYTVEKDIRNFKKHVIDFRGDIHRPSYVKLSWGDFSFKGQISDLSFTYNAFSKSGEPLKAKASVSFVEVVDIKTRLASENKNSPDLTHIVTVKESDTLPMLCYQIYDDPLYYLEIARINNLVNFRDLKPGDQIILPPLEE